MAPRNRPLVQSFVVMLVREVYDNEHKKTNYTKQKENNNCYDLITIAQSACYSWR